MECELQATEQKKPAKRQAPKKPTKKAGAKDEAHTVESRETVRDELSQDVAAFLQSGGKIQEIKPNVTADPPRKPTSNYGSRPI